MKAFRLSLFLLAVIFTAYFYFDQQSVSVVADKSSVREPQQVQSSRKPVPEKQEEVVGEPRSEQPEPSTEQAESAQPSVEQETILENEYPQHGSKGWPSVTAEVDPIGNHEAAQALMESDQSFEGRAIFGFYQELFDRDPDPEGFKYWLEMAQSGTPLEDIKAQMMSSIELPQTQMR